MINDVQPEDEGLYVCHIGILGAEDRELVGGCVIITGIYISYIHIHAHVPSGILWWHLK